MSDPTTVIRLLLSIKPSAHRAQPEQQLYPAYPGQLTWRGRPSSRPSRPRWLP